MEKLQTTCPHCLSDKVRLTDSQPIFIPNMSYYHNQNLTQDHLNEIYQWDEEITAKAICDNCGTSISVEGKIHWNV